MVLWPIAVACTGVFFVFQSVGVDYRTVAAGAVLPTLVSLPWGRPALGSTLLFPVAVLAITMMFTMKRRLIRRRALGVAIGIFFGQIAVGAFSNTALFMWPTQGTTFPKGSFVSSWPLTLCLELLGALMLVGLAQHTGLRHTDRRRAFLSSGRLIAATGAPRLQARKKC